MAKLIYVATHSLDGYTADEKGNFDFTAPDEEGHWFVNDIVRRTGTLLLGRKMYETLLYWETALDEPDQPEVMKDFAQIWLAADKVVYSSSLNEVASARTTLKRSFDLDEILEMKKTEDRDLSIGGPTLAARAIQAGLVDEYHMFVKPVIVGGGTRMLPENVRLEVRLLDEKRFDNGTVYLRYEPT
jgi:dihydrofolate reductase